jgi:hypothetical protein
MSKEFIKSEMETMVNAAETLGKTFIQRWDIFASQLEDGRYVAVKEPLRTQHLVYHLEGKITLGAYVLDPESRARYMVLDSDRENGLEELAGVSISLREKGIPTYLETSRRGGHLWFFFEGPTPGETVRAFGKGIIETHEVGEVELFPKQAILEEGPGSLIRLPFSVHRVTGKRYPFINTDGRLLSPTVREQIAILANAETVPAGLIDEYLSYVPKEPVKVYEANGDELWEKVKQKTTVIDFVGAFVPMRKTGSGAVGNCPFHEDKHASFGVNSKENYFHCFAGCGSGSIIDFWMKWKKVSFTEAVDQLADILGVDRNG